MLMRAVRLLRRLNALVASTNKAASVLSSSKILAIALTPASHPASWPAHNWIHSATSRTSSASIVRIALLIILQETSPITIGRTLGRFFKAISRDAIRVDRPV